MDNGSIFFVFFVAPVLPAIIAIAVAITFALGIGTRVLVGAVIGVVVEFSRARRERAYIRKHQRDLAHL